MDIRAVGYPEQPFKNKSLVVQVPAGELAGLRGCAHVLGEVPGREGEQQGIYTQPPDISTYNIKYQVLQGRTLFFGRFRLLIPSLLECR